MRVNQWSSALQLWTGSWLQGIGPGSYPFQMRLTDYFQQNSYVGRHPDDALIQILAETGVLGICAAGLLIASVVIMARRYHLPQANMFAILVFIFAGLGANPSEYGYLVIILLLWVAHAFPAEPPHSTATVVSWIRPAIFTAAGVIALATMSMAGAAFAFERASANASEKDYNSAVAALSVASALDPGMALYRRERGVARAIIGDRVAALDDLRAAVSLNRADDVAYRSIAVVESQLGNHADATRAASAAVQRVWSDLTNQEVLLRVAAPGSSESISAARASLLLAPWIGDTPAWKRLVAASIPRSELLANSIEPLVVGGVPFPDPFSAVWRAAADSRQKALEQVLEAVPQLRETGLSLRSFLACDASAALSRILAAESREGTDGAYWGVRLLIERQTGSDETRSLHVGSLLAPGLPDIAFGAAVPLDAFGGGARDLWGYRRLPVPHSAATWLVSSQEGQVAWMQRGFRSSACQA
jgi:tetratricopeptide (TPR) repeat protein